MKKLVVKPGDDFAGIWKQLHDEAGIKPYHSAGMGGMLDQMIKDMADQLYNLRGEPDVDQVYENITELLKQAELKLGNK